MTGLTKREWEVVHGVCGGLTGQEIAVQMGISRRTVEVYRAHIRMKLGVRNTAQLVRTIKEQEGSA